MANRFANGAKAFGFCDVCGFRFDLKKLKNLVVKTKQTQIKACPQCWTPDQPQLQLGMYPVADPQAIRDPRPDTNTWYQSGTNGLQTSPTSGTGPLQEGFPGEGMLVIQWGWNPIGGARDFDAVLTPNTLVGVGEVGQFAGFVNTPYVSGPDPYFANVQLLLHMDGTSGSTSFPDNSPAARTVTVVGLTQVDTSVVKFGTGSLFSTGVTGYLSTSNIVASITTPWTVELWVYPPRDTNVRWNTSVASQFTLGLRDSVGARLLLSPTSAATLATTNYGLIPANTWGFVTVVNDPVVGLMQLYVDGVLVGSQGNKPMVNMARVYAAGTGGLSGYVDDVRFTVGVARYSGNFTPPTAPFPNY
jgi:hypothetical protein